MNDRKMRYHAALEFAERQVAALVERHPNYFPIYTTAGKWLHEGELWTDWTGGFLAGMMWQFYARSGSDVWRRRAEHYSQLLEPRQHDRAVHDLGFIFLNAHLPWFAATGDLRLRGVVVQAGRTLAKRFQSAGNYLCSFVAPNSLFIDIMMNVPIIFYAAHEADDPALREIALRHCRTTRATLVRGDGSTAHEGIFDGASGRFLGEATHQGLHEHSRWARGLAWSLYGFTKVAAACAADAAIGAEVSDEMREVAERNAEFWLARLPADGVPYWDFDADLSQPPPLGAQKESSAGAIAASGLLDLADATRDERCATAYRRAALATLDRLVDPEYLAVDTPGWEGILKHGVYHTQKHLGVDESVMWGEFFFVEALTKALAKGIAG
jgi:unsaturated chondroitin disaccharide hydrolase